MFVNRWVESRRWEAEEAS